MAGGGIWLLAESAEVPGWVVGLIGTALGSFMIAGGLSTWGWWWNNHRARRLTSVLGQSGARGLYVVLGAVILVGSLLFAFGIIEPPRR